jgi:hypothetical protein
MRYELADYEWVVIKPMLPNKPRGVLRVDDRRVLNGIFRVLQYANRRTCEYQRGIKSFSREAVNNSDDGRHTPVVKNAAATVLNQAASNFRLSLITVLFKPSSPAPFFRNYG